MESTDVQRKAAKHAVAVQPRWLRMPVLLALGVPYAVLVAYAASRLGMWVVLVGLVTLGAWALWLDSGAARRERRGLQRHLEPRELVDVEEQARALLRERGQEADGERVRALASLWEQTATFMEVDPRRLRTSDDLWVDYRPVRDPLNPPWTLGDELEDQVMTRLLDEDLWTGDGDCPSCGYSHEGLPPERRCPECGKQVVPEIRTLGDYLLFVAGIVPPRERPPTS